jgi:hypothetical protein
MADESEADAGRDERGEKQAEKGCILPGRAGDGIDAPPKQPDRITEEWQQKQHDLVEEGPDHQP